MGDGAQEMYDALWNNETYEGRFKYCINTNGEVPQYYEPSTFDEEFGDFEEYCSDSCTCADDDDVDDDDDDVDDDDDDASEATEDDDDDDTVIIVGIVIGVVLVVIVIASAIFLMMRNKN